MTTPTPTPNASTSSSPSIIRRTFAQGDHWVWMTGAALAVCLIMIAGLLLVVLSNGLGYFWPHPLTQATLDGQKKILGVIVAAEEYRNFSGGDGTHSALEHRTQFKVGNRDLSGSDFRWVQDESLSERDRPKDAVTLERMEHGDFYGFLQGIKKDGELVAQGPEAWLLLQDQLPKALDLARQTKRVYKSEIGDVNYTIREAKLDIKRLESKLPEGPERDEAIAQINALIARENEHFEELKTKAVALEKQGRQYAAVMSSADGVVKDIDLIDIVRAFQPNAMGLGAKLQHYVAKVWEFVSTEPRESNTEGGILPAIFGTVFMTLIMSIAVVPFGVIAAFYLREYAKQGPFVRAVRIAVNNLAGVPSIVFGVFGLGFFVYFVGASIDALFYPEVLPTPTYGTGGILWASLTLALLTVPVVIVATEESIAAVPRGAKEGSLALGASKFQTICRVVLPASLPGILTGLILAIARGAGEVAPLMITGVVKLAPNLPLDGQFPFVHLDRKFMHLGFHIYDVGFQSPNVEAAKPMVFTTALLLLVVVALLNITAIWIRDKIRKKYRTGAFA